MSGKHHTKRPPRNPIHHASKQLRCARGPALCRTCHGAGVVEPLAWQVGEDVDPQPDVCPSCGGDGLA